VWGPPGRGRATASRCAVRKRAWTSPENGSPGSRLFPCCQSQPEWSRLPDLDYIPERGADLYHPACATGLEGVVAKLAGAPSDKETLSWIKTKNPAYTQAVERRERFEEGRAPVTDRAASAIGATR
jgi:hypothetical protein